MNKPAFEGIDAIYKERADNKDIRDLLEKLVPKAKSQMKDFAKSFKGSTDFETCRNIFNYLKNNFTYLADGEEQIIKLPSALLNKKIGDCKSYALFTASILENLGIPYSFVYASYNTNPIPQHVYVVTANGCIIDAVYGKFNKEKKPTYKYKKNMNVRYMAGIGCSNCGGTCNHKGMGKITLISKSKRQAAAAAVKKAATNVVTKVSQGAKTATLSPARNLFLLIVKNNLDGFASKLSTINTTNLFNRWYSLGGDRTILANAIKTGASKPSKKFGFLPKLKKIVGGSKIGLVEVPEGIKSKIISVCTAAGTAIGGTPQGSSAGAMLGGVVVTLLPTFIEALNKVPATEEANADTPLTPPSEAKEEFAYDNEGNKQILPPQGSQGGSSNNGKDNTMLYVGGAALVAAGIYFATKKK